MDEHRVGYKILIADDDVNVHQSLSAYFKREGYQILSAYDGEEAMNLAKNIKPDMILLDIMMPKKDGLVVCREIRRESNVPIIMLTAKAEEFDKLLGLELGADDYITKPFSPREVLARVKTVLRRMREIHEDPFFAGVHMSVGLSNFTVMLPTVKESDGTPVKTPLANAFLTRAMPLGLDMSIASVKRRYATLKEGDPALVCFDECLQLEGFDVIMRVQEFCS